jgi:hypothetical protein
VIAVPDALDDEDRVPHVDPVHEVPEGAHVTPPFAASFVTVAINCCVAFTCTFARVGATFTRTTLGVVPRRYAPWKPLHVPEVEVYEGTVEVVDEEI